jgi:hypothetical protein
MPQLSSNPFSIRIAPVKLPPKLPSWVPPAGFFADVPMLNNPQDITPAIYKHSATDSYFMDNPFTLWGGSAILRDYSDLGAQVYYSGGHEASYTLANVQFTLICDFSTLRWSVANVPLAPNIANTFIKGLAADGSPYNPHTYLGLQEVPKAWGGGEKGSLASFFWSGAAGKINPAPATRFENRINLMDVSRAQMGYSQLATRQPQNADPTKIRFSATTEGGAYPITEIDMVRKGWWVATNGKVDFLLFVEKSGTITQYPALGGNLANGALVLCPSLNLLIAVDGGYSVGRNATNAYRTLHIRNLTTGAVTKSLTLGTVPSLVEGYDGVLATFNRPDVMGLQWVEELGCIVGFDQSSVPPSIVKLSPPSSNPATAQWTWSKVPVQHWPQDANGQAKLQTAVNSIWSKFRWVPSLQAFVYGTAKDRKPQVIKLS